MAHRVGEIHEETNPVQWRYLPTSLNPADRGTRGITVAQLKDDDLWWNGPEFLAQTRDKWPTEKFEGPTSDVDKEMKPQQQGEAISFIATQNEKEEWRLAPSKYFKWYRVSSTVERLEVGLSLVRVRAWVHRFITNCRKSKEE